VYKVKLIHNLHKNASDFSQQPIIFYSSQAFKTCIQNGAQHNAATENQGSAKVFSFAKLQGLDQAQTLSLFAEHYASVLATPEGTDHQNIRQFMQNGWDGVKFEGQALTEK